jgi:hypothetical protein
MTSVVPAPAGMGIDAVVVVLDDSPPIKTVGAVLSCAEQVHPDGAVIPVGVTTTVQELAPSVIKPAVAPPEVAVAEQPLTLNLVPVEMIPGT